MTTNKIKARTVNNFFFIRFIKDYCCRSAKLPSKTQIKTNENSIKTQEPFLTTPNRLLEHTGQKTR